MAMSKNITLGSGKLYLAKRTGSEELNLKSIAVEANQIGLIKGGATLSYKPTIYTVNDDLQIVIKRFITSEEVTLTSGIITFDLAALHTIVGNNEYSDDAETKIRTMKLGNPGAVEQEEYVVCFVHEKTDGTVIRVGMACTNNDGLTLAFTVDKETQVDMTFTAVSSNDKGVLCVIEEDTSAVA